MIEVGDIIKTKLYPGRLFMVQSIVQIIPGEPEYNSNRCIEFYSVEKSISDKKPLIYPIPEDMSEKDDFLTTMVKSKIRYFMVENTA